MIDFDKIKQEVRQRIEVQNSAVDPWMGPPNIGL